ncbi:hypothetical protein BC832DRAFT_549845 [Gaertneriomyces semiglobifer]|nr:hypothetical protein BC832DRAFT_549845 [Gaertneriomyces semiglobifer]
MVSGTPPVGSRSGQPENAETGGDSGASSGGSTRSWTRKALWLAVENADELIFPLEDFTQNLVFHEDALQNGLLWYKGRHRESRDQIMKIRSKPRAEFVIKMSELLDLDELKCDQILESCIKNDLEAPAVKRRIDWSNATEVDYQDENLVVAVQQQYLDEREETLLALSAIIRAADDDMHPYHEVIRPVASRLFENAEISGRNVLDQLRWSINSTIPPKIKKNKDWAIIWAKQLVKEQKLLLQTIFLIYFSLTPRTPAFSAETVEILIGDFNCGKYQPNESYFDGEARRSARQVVDLCVLLCVLLVSPSSLPGEDEDSQAEEDEIPVADAFVEDPQATLSIYKTIENAAMRHTHPEQGDPLGPIMLAWGTHMQSVFSELRARQDDSYLNLCSYIDRTPPQCPSWSRLPYSFIQRAYIEYDSITYLASILRGPIVTDEKVASGYKSVVKGVLMGLFDNVQDPASLPQQEVLLNCMCLIFRGEPQLSLEWWAIDYEILEHRALMDSYQSIFPVNFEPLITFLTSLTNDAVTAEYVFKYLQTIPCLADYLRNGDYSQDPFIDSSANEFRWEDPSLNGVVKGARDLPFLLEAGATARLVEQEPAIVVFDNIRYSGWHLMISLLDSFVNHGGAAPLDDEHCITGTSSVVTEVLKLWNALLEKADSALMSAIELHLASFASEYVFWREDSADLFVGLMCQVLNRACTISPPPMDLLTNCLGCLTSLLEIYPDAVWKHLRTEALFPRRSPSSATSVTSATNYMEEVILPAESAVGQYPTTIAFLDFVLALIKEAQILRELSFKPSGVTSEMEVAFVTTQKDWDKSRDAAAMMDEDEHERVHAVRAMTELRELLALKAEVLYSAVFYVHSEIFPKYAMWRYRRIRDKYQIGLRILSMFNSIMWDSTWAYSEDKPVRERSAFAIVQECLTRSFLLDGGAYQITPLLDIAAIGNDVPAKFYRNMRPKTANIVEECIEEALKLMKYLLKKRKKGQSTVSLLERLILDRTVPLQSGGNLRDTEVVQVLGRYISYENYRPLPQLAAEVITLLCDIAAAWQPRPPSFAGYFGPDVDHFLRSIIRLLKANRISPISNERLQTALFDLVAVIVATQPGLATILLSGEVSRPVPAALRGLDSVARPLQDNEPLPTLSVLVPAVNLVKNWQHTLETMPTTLPAAMRMLDIVWQNAPQYKVILEKIRGQPDFWRGLEGLFGDTPEKPIVQVEGVSPEVGELTPFQAIVQRYCYSKQCRVYALRILAFEVYFMRGNKPDPTVLSVVKKVFTLNNDAGELALFTDDSSLPYDSQLSEEVAAIASQLMVPFDLKSYRYLPWSDDFDADHQYSSCYIYNLDLVRLKLCAYAENGDEEQDDLDNLLAYMAALNDNRSVSDVHVLLARAWKKFVEVMISTFSRSASKANASGFQISNDQIYNLAKRLVEQIAKENGEDPITIAYRTEVSELALFLVAAWGDLKRTEKASLASFQQATAMIDGIRQAMAPDRYSLGPVGYFSKYPFHEQLTSALTVALRILPTAKDQADDGGTDQQMLQEVLQDVARGVGSALRGVTAASFEAPSRIISVSLACLTEIIREQRIPSSISLPILDRHKVVTLLLEAFQKATLVPLADQVFQLDDILVLLMAIGETDAGAERLAMEGIVAVFTNNSITPAISHGKIPPYVGSEVHPWHHHWCQILALLARLLHFLGGNVKFVKEMTGFIRLYQTQIVQTLDVRANPILTLGRVKEIRRLTEVFYALASWAAYARPQHGRALPDYAILEPYKELALSILSNFAYLFDNPNDRFHKCLPVTVKEREDINGFENENFNQDPHPRGQPSLQPSEKPSQEGKLPAVYIEIAKHMLLITRNIATHLRLVTEADRIIMLPSGSSVQGNILFSPTMALQGGQAATVGILFELVRRTTSLLRKAVETEEPRGTTSLLRPRISSETEQIQMTLEQAASLIPASNIEMLTESALALVASQLSLCKQETDNHDNMKELTGELEETLTDIESLLRNAQDRVDNGVIIKTWKKEDLEKTVQYIKALNEFRVREFPMGRRRDWTSQLFR